MAKNNSVKQKILQDISKDMKLVMSPVFEHEDIPNAIFIERQNNKHWFYILDLFIPIFFIIKIKR